MSESDMLASKQSPISISGEAPEADHRLDVAVLSRFRGLTASDCALLLAWPKINFRFGLNSFSAPVIGAVATAATFCKFGAKKSRSFGICGVHW